MLKQRLFSLAAGLLISLQPWAALAQTRRVGVWLTNSPSPLYYDTRRIETAVEELASAGFNTLYPNVWSRGATFHRSRWAPMELQLFSTEPPPPLALVEIAADV